MKKVFTLATLSLLLMSCSIDDCNRNCGIVIDEVAYMYYPVNGDEIYEVTYVTECNDTLKARFPFNIQNGLPGEPTSPLQRYRVGEQHCFP